MPLAKALAAVDVLSEGRMIAGVGPGSSARDYRVLGLAFEERWQRFDEAIAVLRALLSERVYLWPLGEDARQLELVAGTVAPRLRSL